MLMKDNNSNRDDRFFINREIYFSEYSKHIQNKFSNFQLNYFLEINKLEFYKNSFII